MTTQNPLPIAHRGLCLDCSLVIPGARSRCRSCHSRHAASFRQRLLGETNPAKRPDVREKLRRRAFAQWQDPDFKARVFAACKKYRQRNSLTKAPAPLRKTCPAEGSLQSKPVSALCSCGCGQLARPGRRFLYSHHLINRPAWNKGKPCPHPPGYYTPELREKRRLYLLGKKLPSHWVNAIREAQRSPEVREKISQANTGRRRSAESRRRMSTAQRRPETRAKHRENILRRYAEGRYGGRPSFPECLMMWVLAAFLPDKFRYSGDRSFWVGEKTTGIRNPDFVSMNGEKTVLEVFGRRWHVNSDMRKALRFYQQYGYRCVVVWEDELRYPEKIVARIHGNGNYLT